MHLGGIYLSGSEFLLWDVEQQPGRCIIIAVMKGKHKSLQAGPASQVCGPWDQKGPALV